MQSIKRGDKSALVGLAQTILKRIKLYDATVDDDFGGVTEDAVEAYQNLKGLKPTGIIDEALWIMLAAEPDEVKAVEPEKPVTPPTVPVPVGDHEITPEFLEAKKYEGKGEDDPAFVKDISKRGWPKVGLPSFKTIVGSGFAWCAMFFVLMQSDVGAKYIASAMAKDQRASGQVIEWQTRGIPKSARVGINHDGNCSHNSDNHITWADADCAPQDLIEMKQDANGVWKATSNPPKRKSVTWPGYGGNQGNKAQTSRYHAYEICSVRWPVEMKLPPPVKKSVGCLTGGGSTGESTR